MLVCRIEADSDQEVSIEDAEASPRSPPDIEGVAPDEQNSRRQQKQAKSSKRTSNPEEPKVRNVFFQVSRSMSISLNLVCCQSFVLRARHLCTTSGNQRMNGQCSMLSLEGLSTMHLLHDSQHCMQL